MLYPISKVKILIPKLERIKSIGKETFKWKDPNSIYYRLPEHYKKQQREFLNRLPKPVHYQAPKDLKTIDHEFGVIKRHNVAPIPVLYPEQSKLGIWGGEGVIPGYKRPEQTGYKRPQYLSTKLWRPQVMKLIFYSEILDQYYKLTCTKRTLEQIEEAKGFDNYILATHEVDLKSDIGMQLKREMLLKLAKKDFYSNDPSKQNLIYNRYKKFAIPLEEAEWFGLKPWEAAKKQLDIEEKQRLDSIVPLKELYKRELFEKLEKGEEKPEIELAQSIEKKSIFKRIIEENFK